jgi:bifunctional non-homologous end joining protein LigD
MARSVARRAAAAVPDWIKPQLAELVDAAPEGDEWLHEIKFDGYRMHARRDRGAVKLLTRSGLDWTHKYPAIAAAVSSLGVGQAYLDGELCGGSPDGITSFSMMSAAAALIVSAAMHASRCDGFRDAQPILQIPDVESCDRV